MMRRKNTSRRVHALSSDSIRSDEIAATDMALSRDWSGDGFSDMRIGTQLPGECPHWRSHDPPARQNQLELRQVKAAVTEAMQSARVRTGQVKSSLPLRSVHQMAIKFGRPIEMRDAPRRDTAPAAPAAPAPPP